MSELTQNEKQALIAEACGWKRHASSKWYQGRHGWFGSGVDLPNYFEDLDACAEMEETLTDEQQQQMNDLLWDAMEGRKFLWRATAAQRAEIFGQVKGLWK